MFYLTISFPPPPFLLYRQKSEKKASLVSGRTYVVVAVGTGLGSGVIKYKNGKLHEVVPLEVC